jgi:hypothetical protein
MPQQLSEISKQFLRRLERPVCFKGRVVIPFRVPGVFRRRRGNVGICDGAVCDIAAEEALQQPTLALKKARIVEETNPESEPGL